MPSSDPAQRFTDIIANIEHIERFTEGLNATTFASNEQVVFAVKYALMIISEAAAELGDAATDLCRDSRSRYSMAGNPRPRESAAA